MMNMTSQGEDGKTYNVEMLMLPLDYLNGWLFGVDASRVKPEVKPRLLDYQRECFKVLSKHFLPKPVVKTEQSLSIADIEALIERKLAAAKPRATRAPAIDNITYYSIHASRPGDFRWISDIPIDAANQQLAHQGLKIVRI